MEATEARKISEVEGNSLKRILRNIKDMAEAGCTFSLENSTHSVISDKTIQELKRLGYKVEENHIKDYMRITW